MRTDFTLTVCIGPYIRTPNWAVALGSWGVGTMPPWGEPEPWSGTRLSRSAETCGPLGDGKPQRAVLFLKDSTLVELASGPETMLLKILTHMAFQ